MPPHKRKDLYKRLGVSPTASEQTLKKAYRRLARKLHPDVNPGDARAEARFKGISEAYAVLSDPEKRRLYDEFGEVSLEAGFNAEAAQRAREAFGAHVGGNRPGAQFRGAPGESFAYGDLDELLGDLLAHRGRGRTGDPSAGPFANRRASRRGPDLEATLELEFLEAARGTEKRLVIQRPRADGSVASETVSVRIPAGVATGGRIRVPGKGGEGIGGAPGDLFARIRVQPHPVFRRRGRTLQLDLPVTFREATLGAKVEIPTLAGRATVTVPPGTDGGRVLRLPGKGIPDPGGGPPGDLLATVRVCVPRELDADARKHLDALAHADPPHPRKDLWR